MFTKTRILTSTDPVSIATLIGDSQVTWTEVYISAPDTNTDPAYTGSYEEQNLLLAAGGGGFNFGNTRLSDIYVKGSIGDKITTTVL